MTALEIVKALKSNSEGLLWINDDRKEASFHHGLYAEVVLYNDAVIAKGDPSFGVVDATDGTTYATI